MPAGGDDLPTVFSGSLVVRGLGRGGSPRDGRRTEIGRIGKALANIDPTTPRLTAETRRFVRTFALLGLGASVVAVAIYGLSRGTWLDACLAGIALGMSMLPEEFPLVLAVFMTMGARRISRARVLTRRAAAIESLGSATVLCSDKTGTLTGESDVGGRRRAGAALDNDRVLRARCIGQRPGRDRSNGPRDPAGGGKFTGRGTRARPELRPRARSPGRHAGLASARRPAAAVAAKGRARGDHRPVPSSTEPPHRRRAQAVDSAGREGHARSCRGRRRARGRRPARTAAGLRLCLGRADRSGRSSARKRA